VSNTGSKRGETESVLVTLEAPVRRTFVSVERPLSPAIELRHLRYFLAVYDELHFGRAAQKLHIAQPPLSQAIRKLERELGTKLLERTSRTVRPTAAGRVFAEEARKVVTSFEFAVTETRRASRAHRSVRVGYGIHLSSPRLQRFLAALREYDASLRTEVVHLLGLEQVGRLHAGELDLGIFSRAEDYDGLEWEALFPGELLNLYLSRSHRLASEPALGPEDLGGETLLCSSRAVNPMLYDWLMTSLEHAGYRFARRHETTTDPRDVFLAVESGLGVALGPASFGDMSRAISDEVINLPLDPAVSYPDTIVAWRASPPRTLSGRIEAVRAAAAELYRAASPQAEPALLVVAARDGGDHASVTGHGADPHRG
jgi:DNA-binding transcriptional LysR family regulator